MPIPMMIMIAMTVGFLITGLTLDMNVWNVRLLDTVSLKCFSALALGGVGGCSMVTDIQVIKNPRILEDTTTYFVILIKSEIFYCSRVEQKYFINILY